jgi:hypothetical protein
MVDRQIFTQLPVNLMVVAGVLLKRTHPEKIERTTSGIPVSVASFP